MVLFGCACAGAAPASEGLEKADVQPEHEKDDLQAASSSCKQFVT